MVEGETHRRLRKKVLRILRKKKFETRNEVPLYIRYQEPFSVHHISDADIVAKKGERILLIEVEGTKNPSPKLVIGDVVTTNLARECRFKREPLRLSNVRLFIVTREFTAKSRKESQLSLIKKHLKLGEGCLKDFDICPIGKFGEKLERELANQRFDEVSRT